MCARQHRTAETADVIDLSDDREPEEVHIVRGPGKSPEYYAIPLAADKSELGSEYEATTGYIAEIMRKTDVEGEIEYIREWSDSEAGRHR